MLNYPKNYRIIPEFHDEAWLLQKAEQALTEPAPHITDVISPRSAGGIHDYYSDGDYWWPNPDTSDGLPYIRRDGETNPDNFDNHRLILRHMRDNVVSLTCAYQLTQSEVYAQKAVSLLSGFFLDPETRMAPHLSYAQAISGICTGRGIGIIDTIHLADIPFAANALNASSAMTKEIERGLKDWFSSYLEWMLTSSIGIDEMNTENNHCICYFMQAAAFSLFTDNEPIASFCRDQYKRRLLSQMNFDGSFPLELARTKPYNYSAFALDNLTTICHILSTPEDNLWEYQTTKGACIHNALEFMAPYIIDKTLWPYPPDIMHFDSFPVRYSFLMFAGCTLGIPEYIRFFRSMPEESQDEEARRNLAVFYPALWM